MQKETLTSPLVLTKIRVPAARGNLIPRAHLVELLNANEGAGFSLVCAPAGYGKTTLLSEWAQFLIENETAVIWYSMDIGDDDPIPFRAYLIASLLQALGQIPELIQLAQLQRTTPELDMQFFLTTIINVIMTIERKCVIILDDYHLIGVPAIHDALSYLIEHLPGNMRITIGSRADPPLPLARLRAQGKLIEIRAAELRFNEDETTKFLNDLMNLGLPPEGIAALEERTEGWITGLQLAALSLFGRTNKEEVIASFSGGHRYLVEYLMEEVVYHQSKEVQSFLLATSILERLSAPLCDQIMRAKETKNVDPKSIESIGVFPFDSQTILENLERSNLFLIPLDEGRVWFRYHHLFRDFLRSRLERDQPERIPVLHRSACDWLEKQSSLREAANHAFQSRDWEYAAAFVEQHSYTQITLGEISIIYEWCSTFPEDVMQKHPILCLQQALSLAYSFRGKNRPRIEARLNQVDQLLSVLEDKQLVRNLIDLAGVVRTFMGFAPDLHADPHELLKRAESMVGAYSEGDAGQFSWLLLVGYAQMALQDAQSAVQALASARQIALHAQLYFGIVESTFHLAQVVHNQGKLDQASEIYEQGLSEIAAILPKGIQELPPMGGLHVGQGCIFLEQNHLEEAEHHLLRGLEMMGGSMNPLYLMTAYVGLFRLCEFQGRSIEAMKYLDCLEAIWPDVSFCTEGLRVIHLLRTSGEDPAILERIANWSQKFSNIISDEVSLPGIGPFGAADAFYLAFSCWVQAHIALGKAKLTKGYLQQQLDLATKNGLKQRVIELSLLDSLVSDSEADDHRSSTSLNTALSLAQPAGYIRIFDQSPALSKLLEKKAGQGPFKEYICLLQALIGLPQTNTSSHPNQAFFGEALSNREMDVLRLIAQGATNQEIADQLVLTVGTVKSHINHILGKLDSHNRTEAVARARQLRLLEI